MVTPIQVDGVFETPINPIALAISLDASFVARGSVGEPEKTKDMIKRAISHKGFALVDVFQACVSFNRINTHKWFKEHTYFLEDSYDPHNRPAAFKRALEEDPMGLGIFYVNENKKIFEENLPAYKDNTAPLYARKFDMAVVEELMEMKK